MALGAVVALGAISCSAEDSPTTGEGNNPSGAGDAAADDGDGPGDEPDDGVAPPSGGGKIDASGSKVDGGAKSDASKPPASGDKDAGTPKPGTKDGGGTPKPGAKDAGPDDVDEPPTDDEGGGGPLVNGRINLAIAPGEPLDRTKSDAHPSAGYMPPTGWNWYNVEGAKCRDGSPMGIFAHFGEDPEKLFIYFEGGGACANPGFCTLNPDNVSEQFLSGGESAVASLVILPQPQAPNGTGVFDLANADNPFKGWSQVFIPYCTGDVYSGTRTGVMIEGVAEPQNFYGAANTKKIIARLAATFKKDLKRFVAGGSSAGGFGAGINFGAIQDTFPEALGSALLDASPPFTNDFMPTCLQKRWRETWGIDDNYPADCGEQCRNAEGGNLFQIVDYWREKYPKCNVALISGIHDEIIRLFYSLGNDDCGAYGGDPTGLFIGTLGDTYPPDKFKMGLEQLRSKYVDSKQLSTYYMDGFPNSTAHQTLFRPRFYENAAGGDKPTIAEFIKQWVDGEMTQVGP
jgi:hypothetical protein